MVKLRNGFQFNHDPTTNNEIGLWSRDTPLSGTWNPNANGGYFMGDGYDSTATSFHILTTQGILGRDIGGGY